MRPRSKSLRVRTVLAMCLLAAGAVQAQPLDLATAFRLALERDPTFAGVRLDTQATQEEIAKSRAGLLPNVAAIGTVTRNDLESTSPDILGRSTTRKFSYASESYAVQLRQPLLQYGRWTQLKFSQAQAAYAVAQERNERQQLAQKVAESYFSILLAVEQLRQANAEVAAYEATLAQAERGFAGGIATLTDISDARARRDLARAKMIELRNGAAKLRRQLEARIGERIASLAGLDGGQLVLAPPQPAAAADWVQRAFDSSAEIEAANENLRAAQVDIQRQRSQHAPTVDLIAAAQKADSETISTVNTRSTSSYFGVQVSIPIYSGGGIQASVRQAVARRDKAEQQIEALKRDLETRVREQYDAVVQGVDSVKAYEQALRSAEEALRGTQKGLQAGTRTSVDLLNAEAQVFAARQSLAQARFTYVLSLLRLNAAAGTLTEAEIARINGWLGGSIVDVAG